MKLIDKDALVAKIKDLKLKLNWSLEDFSGAKEIAYDNILDAIDGLEVKEVDLDSNIRAYLTNHFNVYEDGVLQSKKSSQPLSAYDIIKVAKHFFELGIAVSKTQKGVENEM